jgi:hypothetical protein
MHTVEKIPVAGLREVGESSGKIDCEHSMVVRELAQ